MKYLLILLTLLAVQSTATAKDRTKTVWIQSSVADTSLSMKETKFTFVVQNSNIYGASNLIYQVDKSGENLTVSLTSQKMFSHTTGTGAHKFVIDAGWAFKEIKTRLKGNPGHHVTVILNFKSKRQKKTRQSHSHTVQPKKPVIYLYPETETDVFVALDVAGKLTFSYPTYEGGWHVTANPDGTFVHEDSKYNYLFWESTQTLPSDALDLTKGFIVKGENVTAFLEESLSKFGFTSKEMADFITFWVPEMKDNPNLYICYVYNKACNAFAELSITPEPDVLARFYMLWSPIAEDVSPDSVDAQEIPTFERNGFVVLEWGGMEININTLEEIN